MKPILPLYFVAIAALALGACSSMSSISSNQTGTRMMLKEKTLTLPTSQNLRGTSFGNYEFEAKHGETEPFYGILPLKFKGGHLAMDILLFAPAAFFNLRAVFPFYEIDVDNGIIRYKNKRDEAWIEYKPKPEEAQRARDYYRERTATSR
jgi:hypothetical protein